MGLDSPKVAFYTIATNVSLKWNSNTLPGLIASQGI